jgi:hypothetical protein
MGLGGAVSPPGRVHLSQLHAGADGGWTRTDSRLLRRPRRAPDLVATCCKELPITPQRAAARTTRRSIARRNVVVSTSRELTAGVRTTRRSIFREEEYSIFPRLEWTARFSTRLSAALENRFRDGSRLTGYVSGFSQDVFVIFVILPMSSVYTQYSSGKQECLDLEGRVRTAKVK